MTEQFMMGVGVALAWALAGGVAGGVVITIYRLAYHCIYNGIYRDLKRLRLMDRMNERIINRIDPGASDRMSKQEMQDKLVRSLAAMEGEVRDVVDSKMQALIRNAENNRPTNEQSGATVFLPPVCVSGFLSHIEIDGFKGDVVPGPGPGLMTVKVEIGDASRMPELAGSISRWDEMRKSSNN
jgi:hypothetical protein